MRLVVGLGNPGASYHNNRHNAGFMLLEKFAAQHDLKFKKKIKYNFIQSGDVLFIKPNTFMNRSGLAVTSARTSYKIDEILVIVDDIYLPLGEIRIKHSGGSGGHNGLKSIAEALGTDKFKRLRIGVGAPGKEVLSHYVLSNFSEKENKILETVFELSEKMLDEYVDKDFDHLVNLYSRLKKSYSEKIKASQNH